MYQNFIPLTAIVFLYIKESTLVYTELKLFYSIYTILVCHKSSGSRQGKFEMDSISD